MTMNRFLHFSCRSKQMLRIRLWVFLYMCVCTVEEGCVHEQGGRLSPLTVDWTVRWCDMRHTESLTLAWLDGNWEWLLLSFSANPLKTTSNSKGVEGDRITLYNIIPQYSSYKTLTCISNVFITLYKHFKIVINICLHLKSVDLLFIKTLISFKRHCCPTNAMWTQHYTTGWSVVCLWLCVMS